MINIETSTTTKRNVHLKLTRGDIVELLDAAGYDVPYDATVEFHVPNGGDWNGCDLGVDASTPVRVAWSTEEES